MKKIFTLLLLISIFASSLYAQVLTKSIDEEQRESKLTSLQLEQIATFNLNKQIDTLRLLREDEEEQKLGVPFRFGVGFDVDIGFEDGKWEETANGKIWRILITSQHAYSLNFQFDDFYLAEGAELRVYNIEMDMEMGPFTSEQNSLTNFLATDLIKGESVIIELLEPSTTSESSRLHLSRIVHAYKPTFSGIYAGYGQSESCNIDVACSQGNDWQQQSNSAALIILADGTRWCSGALVNNTCQDLTPNFLTAFHCLDMNGNGVLSDAERNAVQDWIFRFQYKSPSCNGSDGFSFVTMNGATFRSAWETTDFALLELNDQPDGSTGITYAGWTRTTTPATPFAGIHHPNGDVMKISIANGAINSVGWPNGPANTHWRVTFNEGTVEHGSSGSPLFEQSGRIVGQLHGNQNYTPTLPYCDQPIGEYGRFDVSWDGGGTPQTRLRDWLDPDNTDVMTLNTIPGPYISGQDMMCSFGTSYTVHNIPDGAAVTSWQTSEGITHVSGTNPAVFTTDRNGELNGWIEATITSTCGTIATSRKNNLILGSPSSIEGNIIGPSEVCPFEEVTYYLDFPSVGATYYEWDWFPTTGWIYISGQGTTHLTLQPTVDSPSEMELTLWVDNDCGGVGPKSREITVKPFSQCLSAYAYSVYPNPANDILKISCEQAYTTEAEVPEEKGEELSPEEFEATLYNDRGEVLRQGGSYKGEIEFEVESIPDGMYFLHIRQDDEVIKRKVIVQH